MPFPLHPSCVARAEAKLGAKLPPAYVASMLDANGGTVEIDGEEWELYPILDETDAKRIARTCNDILYETEQAREWDGFPEAALAIGGNGGSDQLVLLRTANGEYDDTLHIWLHETREVVVVAPAAQVFQRGKQVP